MIKNQSEFIKGRFLYRCWEEKSALCFGRTDMQLKQVADYTINICPVFYKEKSNHHITAQSLKLSVDTGKSNFKQRIYICWADQKNGENNWDVFLVYSDDMGLHWTEPILVTYRPNHKNQMFPKMHIDPQNGHVYLVYCDQQNYTNKKMSDVYLAKSENGGLKFDYGKLNDTPLKLKNKSCFENNLLLKDRILKAIWTDRIKEGYFQVAINDSVLKIINQNNLINNVAINNTCLFENKMTINFDCQEDMDIRFELTKPIEPAFKPKIIASNYFKKGNNQLLIDMQALKINKANYTLTLYYKGINKFIWITEE